MATTAEITCTETVMTITFYGDLIYGASVITVPVRNIRGITLSEYVDINRDGDESISLATFDGVAPKVTAVNGIAPTDNADLFAKVCEIIR